MPCMPPVSLWAVLDDMCRRLNREITEAENALSASVSPPVARPQPETPAAPLTSAHGRPGPQLGGTWQRSRIDPADVARVRNSAHLAKRVLPDALGQLVYRDTIAWCDMEGRFGGHAERLAIADDLERMALTKVRAT
jgi:hypothetical protein